MRIFFFEHPHPATPLTGVTVVGSPYAIHITTHEFLKPGQSAIHEITPLTGVTDVGSPYTKQNTCSIQVIRRPMHGVTPVTPLTGVTDVGSPYTEQNTCSIQVTPLTGIQVLRSPGWPLHRESHGGLWVWALHGRSLGLGTPESLMVVLGVGTPGSPHGSLWGWAPRAVSGGSFSGRGADEERAGVLADFNIYNNTTPRVGNQNTYSLN